MRIGIIGAGAAGMMCAATIVEETPDVEVFLIDKNPVLGKKVMITGGGRCNVTTGIEDIAIVLKKYPRGDKFLQSALRKFSPHDTCEWFEHHGVPLMCEDDMRVFPQSQNGQDVVNAFMRIYVNSKTTLLLKHDVTSIGIQHGEFCISFKNCASLVVDRVVLTSGGQAYRQTGSSGDGYAFAQKLGHHITPLAPSLNSFVTLEKWPGNVSGLSFPHATLTAKTKKRYMYTGPFLFTHNGMSGPVVFALSSLVAFESYSRQKPLFIHIDVLPDMHIEKLMQEIKKLIKESPKKLFKNAMRAFIPLSLVDVACTQLHIAENKKNGEIDFQTVHAMSQWIKHIPLSVVGRGVGDEFVTAGGIETHEIDPRTMQSKVCPGLYVAGEILNIDGFTGGFNLQAAWSTGRVAGFDAVL
jgi:hypothetical protein